MRNDVKKYYQSQFGSFASISAKEISELNNQELYLLELPGIFYHKEKSTSPEFIKKLRKLLANTKN